MRREGRRWGGWLLGGAFAALAGCNAKDEACLERVAQKLAAHAEGVTAGTHHRITRELQALQTPWDDAPLDARVAARLRWDKPLEGAAIQVKNAEGVVIELTGTVLDPEQRRRALELARETVGVEEVRDGLEESSQ